MTSPLRLYSAILLLVTEILFLSLVVDASTLPRQHLLGGLLAHAGDVLRWSLVFSGILALYYTKQKGWISNRISDGRSGKLIFLIVVVHLALFLTLLITTIHLFAISQDATTLASLRWLFLTLITFLSWCLIIVGIPRWIEFLNAEKSKFLIFAIGALCIVYSGLYFQRFWPLLNLFTLSATREILELLHPNVYSDIASRTIGIGDFLVIVDSACSGIEGIVVAISTTAIYLYLSRHSLRFPHALALLPIACLFSVLLNLARISMLIFIGYAYSPRIAIEGFHSVAGWLAAVLVALLIVFVFSSWSWIQKTGSRDRDEAVPDEDSGLVIAILTPFAAFIGLTIFSRIFSVEFEYFYSIKVVVTAFLLWHFRKVYLVKLPTSYAGAILCAVVAAMLWVLLYPEDPAVDAMIFDSINAMPAAAAVVWICLRLISFWVLVPIIEEFVFRGYLLPKLSHQTISLHGRISVNLAAVVVSAAFFGLIHQVWIAGFIAGVLYAVLRYKSRSIYSCVVAHGLTNFFLTCWAVYSGRWSLI